MRILLLTDLPPYDGGSGYSGAELHNGLTLRNHRVISIAPIYPDRHEGETGSWILGNYRQIKVKAPRAKRVLGQDNEPNYWASVEKACRDNSFDIVLSNSGGFAPAGEMVQSIYGARHIATVRGYPVWDFKNDSKYNQRLLSVSSALRRAMAVVAVSQMLARGIEKYLGVACRVIRNSPTIPVSLGTIPGFNERPYHVLFTGTLTKRKNATNVIRICKVASEQCGRIKLTLIGRGSRLEAIHRLAYHLEDFIDVSILGFRPRIQVFRHMLSHKVLILPSHFEGDPRVVKEAAACGMPSLVLDRDWAEELEGGIIYFNNVTDGAQALKRMLCEADSWAHLSSIALEQSKRRSPDDVLDDYEEIMKEIVTC